MKLPLKVVRRLGTRLNIRCLTIHIKMDQVTVLPALQKTNQPVTLERWSTYNNRLHFASEDKTLHLILLRKLEEWFPEMKYNLPGLFSTLHWREPR
jgi:hypothetical protein